MIALSMVWPSGSTNSPFIVCRARRKPSSPTRRISPLVTSIRLPVSVWRLSCCAMAKITREIISFRRFCGTCSAWVLMISRITGNSSAGMPASVERLCWHLITVTFFSLADMETTPSGSLRTISVSSLPGSRMSPSSSTSAFTDARIVSDPSVQVSTIVSSPAVIRTYSSIGEAGLAASARVAFTNPMIKSCAEHFSFMLSSPPVEEQ